MIELATGWPQVIDVDAPLRCLAKGRQRHSAGPRIHILRTTACLELDLDLLDLSLQCVSLSREAVLALGRVAVSNGSSLSSACGQSDVMATETHLFEQTLVDRSLGRGYIPDLCQSLLELSKQEACQS